MTHSCRNSTVEEMTCDVEFATFTHTILNFPYTLAIFDALFPPFLTPFLLIKNTDFWLTLCPGAHRMQTSTKINWPLFNRPLILALYQYASNLRWPVCRLLDGMPNQWALIRSGPKT